MQVMEVEGLRVECVEAQEVWRVHTLHTKEEGTIRWLRAIQPGEVVYDVGANIGLYSLLAAKQGARVYAFEPHAANAARLLRNVSLNHGLLVTVITTALHSRDGFLPFNYLRHGSGSSGSQLGHTTLETGGEFTPKATELKYAATLDRLIADGLIPPAHRIKIDVDGNELHILQGARGLLWGCSTVRSVQVEIHPTTDVAIVALMAELGYGLTERHYTSNGRDAIARGADPTGVPHNAVFARTA